MTKQKFLLYANTLVCGPAGPRTLGESADYCTRCNACVQSCPSYLIRREEAFSPRGRNQILRLLLERKLKFAGNETLLKEIMQSCLLCARCTAACAGALPVADHVLALRRAAAWPTLPGTLATLLRWRGTHPVLFEYAIQILRLLRRAGAVRLLRLSALTRLPPLRWITHADDILPHRGGSLRRTLKKQKINFTPDKPGIIYLPSLEAAYLDENIGQQTLRRLKDKTPYVLFGFPSGLFEYLYGCEALCRARAKKLLAQWEKLCSGRKIALLTDSLEVYLFLKHYPVLFAAHPKWRARAEAFAARTEFITDLSSSSFSAEAGTFAACGMDKKNTTGGLYADGPAALDSSSVLYPAGETAAKARKILKTHLGKNFVECEYSRFVIPAGGAAFMRGAAARETALENVKDVARRQIRRVYCLSGFAALELNAALRRHYPQAQARHIVYLQAKSHERIQERPPETVRRREVKSAR